MFNFNFGKKRVDKKQIILISAVLSGIVATLSQCSGVPSERLWDFLDEVQRTLFPHTIINDVLLQDTAVMERRSERDVDKAIREYERLTKDSEPPRVPLPRLIEKALDKALCHTKECQSLGGEMRLCSPWIDTCKDTSETVQRYLLKSQTSVIMNEWLGNEPLESRKLNTYAPVVKW